MGNQDSLTDVLVTWTPSEGATGYIISYEGEGRGGIMGLQSGSIDNYLLTGLVPNTSYTITIEAISEHFSSLPVQIKITTGKVQVLNHWNKPSNG